MWFDHQAFFTAYEDRFAPLTAPKRAGLDVLIGFMQLDPAIHDIRIAAYMLATVKHECADSWQPITEWGPDEYFDKYEPNTPLGVQLGNINPGDGRRYKGRGYVQITGRSNYSRLGDALGIGDALVNDPDRALDPLTAYRILSMGMLEGMFTGRALGDYVSERSTDYVNARRVVNGLDHATTIAAYALGIEQALYLALLTAGG